MPDTLRKNTALFLQTDIKGIDMRHEIFDRDVRGEMVSPNDPGYELLITDILDTMKTATEMNTG